MSETKVRINLNDSEMVSQRIEELKNELRCLRRIQKATIELKKNESDES